MKILLLGEFSGVHNNLKKGLEALGHSVVLANDGDQYKNFDQTFKIRPYKGRYWGKILNTLCFFFNIRRFTGYDIVQYIKPFAFPYYYYFFGIPHIVMRFNKKIIYYACGTDPAYLRSKNHFLYFPFDGEYMKETPNYNNKGKLHSYSFFLKRIHHIVPSSYPYAVGYLQSSKLEKQIPLPGAGEYVDLPKPPKEIIKILFGITRRGFKGADYILDALDRIKIQYPQRVQVNVVERLPFSEYVNCIQEADILIDQCKSYGYGMNAIFALERGVIVLSGAEKEYLDYAGLKDCPVINILPNVDQIEKTIQALLDRSDDELFDLKKRSVEYTKIYHDPKRVAELFLNIYKQTKTNRVEFSK